VPPNELKLSLPEDYNRAEVPRRRANRGSLHPNGAFWPGGAMAAGWSWAGGGITPRIENRLLPRSITSTLDGRPKEFEQVKRMHEKQRAVVHHGRTFAALARREKVPAPATS